MLRQVEPQDISIFFEHQDDPVASAMAAFPSRDRAAHDAHWAKLLADDSLITRTIVEDGQIVGNIGSWVADAAGPAGDARAVLARQRQLRSVGTVRLRAADGAVQRRPQECSATALQRRGMMPLACAAPAAGAPRASRDGRALAHLGSARL